jgi:hypothetical protein
MIPDTSQPVSPPAPTKSLLYISRSADELRSRVMQMSPADDPSDLLNAVAELATLVSQLAVESAMGESK